MEVQIYLKLAVGANPWYTVSADEGGLCRWQPYLGGTTVLTAAPLYKVEGMIVLQLVGQQLRKYPLISQSDVKTSLQAAPLSHSTLGLMKYLTTSVDKKWVLRNWKSPLHYPSKCIFCSLKADMYPLPVTCLLAVARRWILLYKPPPFCGGW